MSMLFNPLHFLSAWSLRAPSVIRALTFLVVYSLFCDPLCAQLVFQTTRSVQRPPGQWADTVLVSFDPTEAIGGLRRVDPAGIMRTTHIVWPEHPSAALMRMLGPGAGDHMADGMLCLKLNRLKIDERNGDSYCSMHAEVIQRTGVTFRRVYESSITVKADRCREDIRCHEDNLASALQQYFQAYETYLATPEASSVEVPDISSPFVADSTNTPILGAQVLHAGLYRTFEDMRMNKPDTLYQVDLREHSGSDGALQIVELKGMRAGDEEKYWGLNNGINVYKRFGHLYYRLDRIGDGYSTLIPPPSTVDPSAVVLGGIFFGVIGAGIVAAASEKQPPPILYDVEMLCGGFVPHDEELIRRTFAQHIFYVTSFAKSDAPITLSFNGPSTRTISRAQWTAVTLPPSASLRRVTLTSDSSEEVIYIDTNHDGVVVHLVDVDKDGTLVVKKLNEQMQVATLEKLKEADRR